MTTTTEWVVWCEKHGHYLNFVGATGTSWRDDQDDATRYPTKTAAREAAARATWRDHRPVTWAVHVRTNLEPDE